MDMDARIARIEERLTWLQRHAVEQDRVISAQSFEIDTLKTKLSFLKKQMEEGGQSGGAAPGERPPHY